MRGSAALSVSAISPRLSQGTGSCQYGMFVRSFSSSWEQFGHSHLHGRAPNSGHKEAGSMNVAHEFQFDSTLGHLPVPQAPAASAKPVLHRIADVRKRQGVSVRSVARRMHTSIDQVRRQEEPACDLMLSELLRWQQALEVPLSDLLVESESPLSEP